MRIKYYALLTLMFCMGVFLFPITAYARNATPPTIDGFMRGDTLRIEAQNGEFAVEAIFINDRRFNFRVDSALIVDLLVFEDSEIITVYAIDFAGNRSNVMMFINPHYIGLMQTQTPTPEPPAEGIPVTSQGNPFTPDGQASVLDHATNSDNKEFFTFRTPAGNVFFLIVDHERQGDNVYFLNAVTERDLLELAEQSGTPIESPDIGGIPVSPNPILPNEPPPDDTDSPTEADPPPADSGGGNGTLIFMLIGIAVAGGAGYYIKIVLPKKKAAQEGDDYEDEDNEDLGEEMEFEDDTGGTDNTINSDEQEESPQGDYYDLSDEGQTEREDEEE